jgi:hypothetical protein
VATGAGGGLAAGGVGRETGAGLGAEAGLGAGGAEGLGLGAGAALNWGGTLGCVGVGAGATAGITGLGTCGDDFGRACAGVTPTSVGGGGPISLYWSTLANVSAGESGAPSKPRKRTVLSVFVVSASASASAEREPESLPSPGRSMCVGRAPSLPVLVPGHASLLPFPSIPGVAAVDHSPESRTRETGESDVSCVNEMVGGLGAGVSRVVAGLASADEGREVGPDPAPEPEPEPAPVGAVTVSLDDRADASGSAGGEGNAAAALAASASASFAAALAATSSGVS